jgi:D-glycero-D-manno-heptose 1,7-bisphosphate phosphatase
LISGVIDALHQFKQAGFLLVAVSNQPAAAKGFVLRDALDAVHEEVELLLDEGGIKLDGCYYCFHHPNGIVDSLKGKCDCRKPAPGLLNMAAEELNLSFAKSWMVGDSDTDTMAGASVNCKTMLIENPHSQHRRAGELIPDAKARDLARAAEIIVALQANETKSLT